MSDGYTEEERQAAWAAYYAQQGYSAPAAASSTQPTYYGAAGYAPGPSTSSYANYNTPAYDPEMALQAMAYNPPAPGGTSTPGASGSSSTPAAANAALTQGYMGADGKWVHPQKIKKAATAGKRETVIRQKGGKVWEDETLLEWDSSWFRLFVGDLSNDVNDSTLNSAFGKYPSYCKCKVVRDRLSLKAKYAFIAFKDPEDYLKAWKEMDGKYVGNRPIRLMKITDKFGGVKAVTIGAKKGRELEKIAKNKGKPLNGRPTPW